MGACQSVPNKSEKERSDEIDKQIEEDAKKFKKECKILLLGACAVVLARISCLTPFVQALASLGSQRS